MEQDWFYIDDSQKGPEINKIRNTVALIEFSENVFQFLKDFCFCVVTGLFLCGVITFFICAICLYVCH